MRARTEGWAFKGCVGRDRDPHLLDKVFWEMEGERVGTELLVLGDRAAPRLRVGREMRGEGGGGEGGEGERRKG